MSENAIKKTAAEYRAEADKLRKQLKEYNRTFVKTGVIMMAVLAVVFIASVAWFANNAKVSTGGIKISTSVEDQFVFASTGIRSTDEEDNYKDTDGNQILSDSVPVIYNSYYNEEGKLVNENISLYTGSAWHIADASEKLYPGAKGYIDFYIIPKVTGNTTASFSLKLTAYGEEGEDNKKKIKIITDEKLLNLLNGHLLFFQGVAANDSYQGWIQDGTFFVTADFQADVPQRVRLYWIWPRRVRNLVYHQVKSEGDLFATASDDYIKLLQRINENQEEFFYNPSGSLPAIDTLSTAMSDELFSTVTLYYNHADEWIGSTVRHIYIELKAAS